MIDQFTNLQKSEVLISLVISFIVEAEEARITLIKRHNLHNRKGAYIIDQNTNLQTDEARITLMKISFKFLILLAKSA